MDRLNKWLSLMANLGVLVGVFVVAYELRQNTLAMEANSRQEFAAHDLAWIATALDPSVVAVAMNKNEAGEQLSDLELSQLVHRQHMNFRIFENAYYQARVGALEASEWGRYDQIIGMVICRDVAAQRMWKDFRSGFVADFAQLVDRKGADCSG